MKERIFRIQYIDTVGNPCTWDLLTRDGEDPNNTEYYYRNGCAPSFNQQGQINQALEAESWEEYTPAELGLSVSDFNI